MGVEYTLLNCLCWGTNRQVIGWARGRKTPLEILSLFVHEWVKHYSWPELIVCDQGKEFLGEDFSDFCGQNGSLVHVVDAKSPWQNGRTERAGGAFKEKLATVRRGALVALGVHCLLCA